MYVTGSAFADIKRFGSPERVPYFANEDEFSLDGTGAGGGLRIGTFLSPRWSLELSVDAGARTEGMLPNPSAVILTIFPPPFADLELKASTRFVAVSTVIGFHPPARGRVQLGYFVGFSFIRGTDKSDYVDFGVPVPLFTVGTVPPSDLLPSPLIFPRPAVATLTEKQNTGGAILGFEAAVSMTDHIAVVPDIRALTFSTINRGPGVFLIRPRIGVRWNF